MIEPELKGSPMLLTIKISVFPTKIITYGIKNLNTKNNIATTNKFAKTKF